MKSITFVLTAIAFSLAALIAEPVVSAPFSYAPELQHSNKHAVKIETFLKKEVPGLKDSYRDVINAMIAEGFDVYIQGGMLRDLLLDKPLQPHDVDLFYSGNPDQMEILVKRNQWMHTNWPGKNLISIGDASGVFIDATPASFGIHHDVNSMEFTLNNIVYHCNSRTFLPGSEQGFQDLQYRRLRVLTDNWEDWLHESGRANYKKIFRFWKMVGKGYVYSKTFEAFIVDQTHLAKEQNTGEFDRKLLSFLSKNSESLNEIASGCKIVMGQKWCEENILAHRDQLKITEDVWNEIRSKHTYYSEGGKKQEEQKQDSKPAIPAGDPRKA